MYNLTDLKLSKCKEFNDLQLSQTTYESMIDFNQQLLHIFTDKSIEELDLMNYNDFNDLLKEINVQFDLEFPLITEITFNDKLYGTISKDEIKFLTKELKTIELLTSKKEYDYFTLVAAVLFREKLDYGIQNDFTDEAIKKRYDVFLKEMDFKTVYPYIKKINGFYDNK
jgi:hypothetical protein